MNMKNSIRKSILAVVMTAIALSATAQQQVNTLYFLENAPVRQYINPSFTPISTFYLSLPVIGYTSLWAGNSGYKSITPSDVVFNNAAGQAITFLHPDADRQKFLNSLRKTTLIDMDLQTSILSFGFRFKDYNYLHVSVNERIDGGVALPKDLFSFLLGGGMQDLSGGNNPLNLTSLGAGASAYTEIGVGYTREINDKWSVGGKLKFLAGTAYMGMTNKQFGMNPTAEQWDVYGNGSLFMSMPLIQMPDHMPTIEELQNADSLFGFSDTFNNLDWKRDWKKIIKPSGLGGAIDLGFTFKPIEQLSINASVTDLGFITWKGAKYNYVIDGTYNGVGEIKYNDYVDSEGNFNGDILKDTITTRLKDFYQNMVTGTHAGDRFTRMISAKLNVGFDANFWDNRVGVGIYSRTRFFNRQVYEEVTLGAAFRPVHWFNIAASYSFINGKWHTIGAALSLVTYEGLGLFIAADYIPLSYAKADVNGKSRNIIPYHNNGLNLAFGLNLVIGHKRDKDRDGVKDKYDLCPDTPRKVEVDKDGCPLDGDGDGVPDYLDQCPDTPEAAYGLVDEKGCPIDSDGDGVPDYLDKCPGTPEAAWRLIDENGCPLDTDGDSVPDYLDQCPETPAAAWGHVDSIGCPLDTDKDGVPDYLDDCPDTPEAARGYVDKHGCPLDSDLDGVPDYLDECPETPRQAYGHVDAKGCLLDTDADGVPDYIDRCNDTPAGTPVDQYGCSPDSDGDGVPDYKDECPNTPKAARGRVDEKGCELDTDADGVPDYKDECPTIPGSKDNHGCPAIKREVRNLLKKAMQGIQFETGKANIKKTSHPLLNQIANVFIENPTYKVEIQGHTDNVGKAEYNQDLSERRAQAVRKYLVGAGVPEDQLTAHGYGDTMPIETNKTAAGRAKNRRVEFVISFEEVTYEEVNDRVQPQDTTATTPQQQQQQQEQQ